MSAQESQHLDEIDQSAYEQADAACRGPHWSQSARPTDEQITSALADAVVAEMVPPSELQRRHERGNHAACPPYWCDHVTPPAPSPDDAVRLYLDRVEATTSNPAVLAVVAEERARLTRPGGESDG